MGLQHAIHDVREDAGSSSRVGRAAGLTGFGSSLGGVVGRLPRLLRSARGGRTSIWRVITLAILVYVASLNLANFVVVRPVRGKLDRLVEQKTVVEDFLLLRQTGQAVAGVRDALMKGDERMTILNEVREMAGQAGMKVVGEPKLLASQEATKRMTRYPMEVTLRGSYHETGEFIRLVESSPRMLSITSIEIDARDSGYTDAEVVVRLGALSWEE